jgi:hypothetical protein
MYIVNCNIGKDWSANNISSLSQLWTLDLNWWSPMGSASFTIGHSIFMLLPHSLKTFIIEHLLRQPVSLSNWPAKRTAVGSYRISKFQVKSSKNGYCVNLHYGSSQVMQVPKSQENLDNVKCTFWDICKRLNSFKFMHGFWLDSLFLNQQHRWQIYLWLLQ